MAAATDELALLDLLCRMQLVAMRLGCRILLDDPSPALRALIRLAGLDEVLRAAPQPPTRRSGRGSSGIRDTSRPPEASGRGSSGIPDGSRPLDLPRRPDG